MREQFIKLQDELGLTNDALGKLLGVSLSTIVKRRAGAVKINKETILAMEHLKAQK